MKVTSSCEPSTLVYMLLCEHSYKLTGIQEVDPAARGLRTRRGSAVSRLAAAAGTRAIYETLESSVQFVQYNRGRVQVLPLQKRVSVVIKLSFFMHLVYNGFFIYLFFF